jgi:putative transcriptional regulator
MIGTMHGAPPVLTNRLSRLMGERRKSIADVSRGSGVSYRALYDLYHDRTKRIDFVTLDRLCSYFGVGPEHILEWRPDGEGAD